MLPRCPGWAWLNRPCLAGIVVGWLVPMVRARVRVPARADGATDYCPAQKPAAAAAARVAAAGAEARSWQPLAAEQQN